MAFSSTHKLQAEHNFKFLKFFRKEIKFIDWQITVAFYTVLHVVDYELNRKFENYMSNRLITSDKVNDDMHAWREKTLKDYYQDIYTSYKILRVRSRAARYLEGLPGKQIASKELNPNDVKECLEIFLPNIIKKFGLTIS